jgi:hypothetical protein
MTSRRSLIGVAFLALVALALVATLGGRPTSVLADSPSSQPVAPGGPDLRTMLEKGLRARRPVEFTFIDDVVQMVDAGTLPESIVQTSFLWARKKRPYPFPYFRQSLKVQAQQIGVSL